MMDTTATHELFEIHCRTDLDREVVSDAWPNVSYKGQHIIAGFYPAVLAVIEPELPESECQECFLSYDPNDDRFVMVFDTWFCARDEYGEVDGESDFGFQLVTFSHDPEKGTTIHDIECFDIAGWYDHGWGIWRAKPENARYVDLRLD